MAKKDAKKQKPGNKQPGDNKFEKKKLKRKKLKKNQPPVSKASYSDSDDSSSGEPDSDKLQKLLEPYPKDQLISFIVDAAVNDAALFSRIRDAADRDVSHRKIFVHGLGWDTTRETLISTFRTYGEIEDCNVITDRLTGKTKGYGFVLFQLRKGANKALKEPRKKIGNRMASCQLSSVGPAAPAQPSQDGVARKIYVSNVPPDADPEKLRAFFAKFGEIETGPIGFDMQTGKSRGFALFVYKTPEGARKALQEQYKVFEGHQLRCQKATDGKNKVGVGGAAGITMAVQDPVLAAVAAAQNMALYNQQYPNLHPMYSGLFAGGSMNPMMAAGGLGQGFVGSGQMGQVGDFGATGSGHVGQLGNFSSSVLGVYGTSSAPMQQQGLQHAYPSAQLVQTPSARTAGSFPGYTNPSYKR